MLANNVFSLGETEINPNKLTSGKTPEGKRSIRFTTGKINQETTLNSNYEIERVNLASSDGRNRVNVNYEQSQLWLNTRYPKKITLSGNMNKLIFSSDIEISRVVFDTPLRLTPAKKSNLTRGNIEQLLSK
jgi:cytochrome c-type biogenesis protein CcmE